MTNIKTPQLRLPVSIVLLSLVCAACTPKDDRPPPPQTGEAAPVAAVTPAEDRGQKQAGEETAPASDEHAFSGVEAGETERAASQRGHDSAAETAPAAPAGNTGGGE